MMTGSRADAAGRLGRLFDGGTATGLTDAELVGRFAGADDHGAFAALVARHGPAVMAVCRGVVGPAGDADDAFQATFLVLLRRAGTFPVGPSLGGWLRRVARRVARQSRRAEGRRRRRETLAASGSGAAAAAAGPDPGHSEALALVRREVDLLPERYRLAVVLCDLQGLTREEAAGRLGWPAGTVGGRLARGRRRLRERLERRGVAPALVGPMTPPALDAAVRAASALATGGRATPAALALAAGPAPALVFKAVAALAVALGFAAVLAAAGRTDDPPAASAAPMPPPAPAATPAADPDAPEFAGRYEGRVVGPDGSPLAGARIQAVSAADGGGPARGPGPVRAVSGADGRFRFDAPDLATPGPDGLPTRRPALVIASADGYAPDAVPTWGVTGSSFVSHSDPVKGADVALRLAPVGVPVRGRLVGPGLGPVAGAEVRLTSLLVPKDFDLDAHLRRRAERFAAFLAPDQARIFDRPDLLPGVDVRARTDADGRFELRGLGRDRLASLAVVAPGFVDTTLEVMTRDAPDIPPDRDLNANFNRSEALYGADFEADLRAERVVRGVVLDRESRRPVVGMRVGTENTLNRPVVTGTDGQFDLPGVDLTVNPLTVAARPSAGVPYLPAQLKAAETTNLVIECTRGIPFRLRVVDEAGAAVDPVTVRYFAVSPNPHYAGLIGDVRPGVNQELSEGLGRAPGVFEGFVIPGPGAVLVRAAGAVKYRPAHVDPKAFFAPGKTDWTAQERTSAYGTNDTLNFPYNWDSQLDYAAIVLVNPPAGSGPLELRATLTLDRPRRVTLLDPSGEPVVGADTQGMTPHPYDSEPRLRAATFRLGGLHPDRVRRIKFLQNDRKLIGLLAARGDGDAPYTVRMQPWAAVTGRLLDENGRPFTAADPATKAQSPAMLSASTYPWRPPSDEPEPGDPRELTVDPDGRFRVERLVPGRRYSAGVWRGFGHYAGEAFRDLTLAPGEVRDLGDVPTRPPVDVRGR